MEEFEDIYSKGNEFEKTPIPSEAHKATAKDDTASSPLKSACQGHHSNTKNMLSAQSENCLS